MDNKSELSKESDNTLPNVSIKSGTKVVSASEGNASEGRNTTKTILEDVCTDFESMDVIPPKNSKIMAQKARAEIHQTSTSLSSAVPVKPARSPSASSTSSALEGTRSSVKPVARNTNPAPIVCEVQVDTLVQNEVIHPQPDETSVQQHNECLEQSSYTTLINIDPALQANSQVLPLNSCENAGNITVVTDSFPDKRISSLAELADAELVPTSDNSVSLIISNPRLIKVLTNSSESTASLSSAAVIDPATGILETNAISNEHIGMIDPAVISNIGFQDITIPSDSSILSESISERDPYSPLYIDKKSDLMNAARDSTHKLLFTKGRYVRKAPKPNVSDTGVKARRISAKMKAAWASELEANGHLICKMPGCSQTFVTVANYQTHFKYCTGKKNLSHCLYCDSLIFSSNRAVLHHMEVEHPDKVEEYKAKYPLDDEFDEGNLHPHLIVAEDENVAMNIEEVTQSTPKPAKKRKLSAKENVLYPQKTALKNKMKSIKETVNENIKEFRKCVRFDNIVDKINSVSDFTHAVENTMTMESSNKKRKKLILNESIVTEEKYFEDEEEEEVDGNTSQNLQGIEPDFSGRINTKARMMLNMERYKRYKEYLKLTRDWSSERKTYSRSRGSESSLDTSYLIALQNEYIQDMHQLHQSEESANISLDTSQIDLNSNNASLQNEMVEAENFIAVAPTQSGDLKDSTISLRTKEDFINLSLSLNDMKYFDSNLLPDSPGKNKELDAVVKKEKNACYNRPSLPNSMSVRNEPPRCRPLKYGPIITYGMTVPVQRSKPVEPPITFDSLVNSFKQPKQVRKNSQDNSDKILNTGINLENFGKSCKEDGIKQPDNVKVADISPKRKRGRPPKIKLEPVDDVKANKNLAGKAIESEMKNKSKRYNSAVLKTIGKNTRNRNARLLAARKNSKFKHNARKYARLAHIRASKSKLKNIKMKDVKKGVSLNNVHHNKGTISEMNNACVNSIICEENIDSHLPVDGVTANVSDIHNLSTDHNYSNFVTDVNAIISSVANENVVGEVEVVSCNVENICDSDKIDTINLQVNEAGEHFICNTSIQQTEGDENSTALKTDSLAIHSEASLEPKTSMNDAAKNSSGNDTSEKCSTTENVILYSDSQVVDKDLNLLNDKRKGNEGQGSNVSVQHLSGNNLNKERTESFVDRSSIENPDIDLVSTNGSVASSRADSVQKANEAIEKAVEVREISAEIDEISLEVQAISAKVQEMSAKIPEINVQKELQSDIKESETCDTPNIPEIVPSNDSNLNNTEKESQIVENVEVNSQIDQIPGSNEIQNSEQIGSVTPEVKVKRGRGRPRKNKGIIANLSNKMKQSIPKNNTKNTSVPNDVKDDQTPIENSEMQDSVTDENKPTAVRKSERVKKRKLVELFESPKVEEKKPEEVVQSTPVIRTGRRGRPRKYPLKDSDLNLSDVKNAEQVQKTPEVESEPVDEKLRKYSRKGRPRKCVRYADINSGVDSSESLDGLNSTKEKLQNSKTLIEHNLSNDVTVNEIDLVQAVKDSLENINENSGAGKIILPLKKRKQNRKDDSVDESLHDTNIDSKQESENLNSSAKKMKFDTEEEKKVPAKSKKMKKLQSAALKKQKKTARKKHYQDSEKISDKEPLITNNVEDNRRVLRASRQKSFVSEINLEDELDESLDEEDSRKKKFKNDSCRKLKDASFTPRKVTSKSGDFETSLPLRQHPVAAENLMSNFKPKQFMWKLLSGMDYCSFLPPLKNSPYFKFEKTWTKSETGWSSLSCFDSAPIDRESCHFTFFTGGPVLSSAWCPTPSDEKITQYIAVAISSTLNKYHTYICTDSEKGLVQLWNVGYLKDKVLDSNPVMELGISHNHGLISDMAWCPSGCWENPSTEFSDNRLPRLGMLALACSDSYIRIYSIPHPSFLPKDSECFPLYSSCPSIILRPMYGGECTVTRKSMCISVAWQKTDYCERIAGGYGNGMIFIWLINSTATILVSKTKEEQIVISPYLIFNAHGTPVTSVSFATISGGRYLVSSSTDRTLKFWDLIDTSVPFFTVRKGASRSAEWANHYCGAFASLDHGINSFKGSSSFFKECGTENFSSRVLSNPCCCVIKSTFSNLLNAQAIADASGILAVSFIQNQLLEHVKFPHYHHRTVYQTKMQLVDGILEKMCFSSYPENVNCINVIQEMKEILSVADKLTEDCDRHLNPSLDEKPEEIPNVSDPSGHLIPQKRKHQYELKNDEWTLRRELSNTCLEIADVVSLITDLGDVISTVTQLTEDLIFHPPQNEKFEDFNKEIAVINQSISSVLCDIIEKVSNEVPVQELTLNSELVEKNAENELGSPSSNILCEEIEEVLTEVLDKIPMDVPNLTEETTESDLLAISNVIYDVIEKVICEVPEEKSAYIVDELIVENITENMTVVSSIVSDLIENVASEIPETELVNISDRAEESFKEEELSEVSDVVSTMIEKVSSLDSSECSKEDIVENESLVVSSTLCDLIKQVSSETEQTEIQIFPMTDLEHPKVESIAQSDCEVSDVISNLIQSVSDVAKYPNGHSSSETAEVCVDSCHSSRVPQCSETVSDFEVEYCRDGLLLKDKEHIISNMESPDECLEASNLIEQTTDLVSLVADINYVVSAVDQITNKDILPLCVPSAFHIHQLLSHNQDLVSSQAEIFVENNSKGVTKTTEGSKCETQTSQDVAGIICSLIKKISEEMLAHPEVQKSNHLTSETLLLKDFEGENIQEVIHNEEKAENVKLLSECLEIRDLVSLVADMKDIVCTMSQLITSSESPSLTDLQLMSNADFMDLNSSSHKLASIAINHKKERFESTSAISDVLRSLVKSVVEKSSASDVKLKHCNNKSITNEKIADSTGLLDACSEIIDVIDAVSDVEDVVSSVTELVAQSEDNLPIPNQIFTSGSILIDANVLSEKVPSLQTCEQEVENSDSAADTRKQTGVFIQNANNTNHINSDGAFELSLVVSDVLNNLTETVSKQSADQPNICSIDDTDVEMVDISEENVALESSVTSATSSTSQIDMATSAKSKLDFYSKQCNELTSGSDNNSSLDISSNSVIVCNNDVPQVHASSSVDSMNYETVEPHSESDDQVMLPVDSESSNSENEMDSDEEVEIDSSFVFDRETNFSDDSMLSECSLVANSSLGSSSDDSVMSEDFSSPVPGDSVSAEIQDSVPHTADQNNTGDTENTSPQPPSLFTFISEISSNLPERKKMQCDSSHTISETLEKSDNDLVSSHSLSIENSVNKNDIDIINETEKQLSSPPVLDHNVPEPSATDVASENCHKLDNSSFENQNTPGNLCAIKDTVETQGSIVSNLSSVEPPAICSNTSHINFDDCTSTSFSPSSTQNHIDVSTVPCTDKNSDMHSSSSTEIVDNTTFSNKPCTENVEHSTENCIVDVHIEKPSQECSSQTILTEHVKKSIFDGDTPPETVCINNEPIENLEETNILVQAEPISEKRRIVPNKKFALYENVVAEYGLVFRDEDTINFENVKDSKVEDSCDFPLDKYHLAAVKTIAWNPNIGSHFWLFSGGQSGLARVSYIPDLDRNKKSKRKDA